MSTDHLSLRIPKGMHADTADLVQRFAEALAAKLRKAELKYGYTDGWKSPGWMDECRARLTDHLLKGDPLDVAAFAAFLWHHNERTFTGDTNSLVLSCALMEAAISVYQGGEVCDFMESMTMVAEAQAHMANNAALEGELSRLRDLLKAAEPILKAAPCHCARPGFLCTRCQIIKEVASA